MYVLRKNFENKDSPSSRFGIDNEVQEDTPAMMATIGDTGGRFGDMEDESPAMISSRRFGRDVISQILDEIENESPAMFARIGDTVSPIRRFSNNGMASKILDEIERESPAMFARIDDADIGSPWRRYGKYLKKDGNDSPSRIFRFGFDSPSRIFRLAKDSPSRVFRLAKDSPSRIFKFARRFSGKDFVNRVYDAIEKRISPSKMVNISDVQRKDEIPRSILHKLRMGK